ncbi:MAG: T9SS type A sorting domain-containing protein [Bacteroidota bacterium]
MKKFYSLLITVFTGFGVQSQIVSFPDPDLKDILLIITPEHHLVKDLSGNFIRIDANDDGEIQISEALQVSFLDLHVMSGIQDMNGIENFTNLKILYASNNVSTVNLNGLVNLETFSCVNNSLTSLDLTGSPNLKNLHCDWGNIATLNCTGLIHLETISANANDLTSLDVSSLTNLQTLSCYGNAFTSLSLNGLTHLQTVNCSQNQLTSLNLSGLINLQHLDIRQNQFSSLDLSGLSNLNYLDCGLNHLTSLDFNEVSNLTFFDCYSNAFQSLDVSGLPNLKTLGCAGNQLISLDLSSLHQLQFLECGMNQLTSLNFAGVYENLTDVRCATNQLPALDVSGLPNLTHFNCRENLLTTLDLSANHHLYGSSCAENPPLTTLNVKNGSAEEYFDIENCPNLQYICADDTRVPWFQTMISIYNLTNCHVNSYCSFSPGGEFYTMQGTNRYNLDGNGCDVSDIHFPNLSVAFSDGTTTSNLMGNDTGAYHYDVNDGTFTITPTLENPSYFSVFPTVSNVTFPTTTSPFIQDFCISANGLHNDLEVFLIPMTAARPGFDAHYTIIYKNKGTNTQSGLLDLSFDDNVLDFVSASPTLSSQAANNLNWNFTNLLPFESRQITITLNVNSPMETPAVNDGDVLHYTATISGLTDETPDDNTFALNQTVRNSLDPNDKICLEGNVITPEMIGNYVHYIIRFENTGTFAAENIVVADVIDLNKFDIATLIPESSSHEFYTRINGNKVEFIFQNINLPFDDANNDGYVVFKIRTKPTLVEGDDFSNSASIYFDYNFPIATNTATTTITALGILDFELGSVFSLSPVPAKNSLTITTKQNITISSVNIYNTLGQLVQVTTNPNETIDVSGLKTGNYFIKLVSDKGTASSKFIKE